MTVRLLLLAVCAAAAHASLHCYGSTPFYPGALAQLQPYFSGISREDLNGAYPLLKAHWDWSNEDMEGLPAYNFSQADLMDPSDPDFPWEHSHLLKVAIVNGSIYLPGGHVPVSAAGYSFFFQGYHVLFDLLELHETAPLPDLEMLVFSGEFAVVTKRGDDGTLPPIFSRYSSRSAYDLTLPGGPYLLGSSPYLPWHAREDRIVGRYNHMCPWSSPTAVRAKHEGEPCGRVAAHYLNSSAENNRSIVLDVGLYNGAPDKNVPRMTPDELARAKYALVLDGSVTADRLRSVLAGGQAVILDQHSAEFTWWYDAMQPWVHYLPIGDQYKDIFALARFLETHDTLASEIAANGRQLANAVSRQHGLCYTRFLLEEYAKLLTFKPHIGKVAVPLRDGLRAIANYSKQAWEFKGFSHQAHDDAFAGLMDI